METQIGNSVDAEWEKEYRDKVFDTVTTMLKNRKAEDPTFTIDVLEQMMDTIYINQGSSWGKSTVVEIKESATACAFEVFHLDWLEEIKKAEAEKKDEK